MFVLTIDQQGSRRVGDRVEALLGRLAVLPASAPTTRGVVRAFERTVGDEVQAVLADAEAAVSIALTVLRWGGWSVGIGAGLIDLPLPASSRAGSGAAFVLARAAVDRAKSRARPVPLGVFGQGATAAADAEAVLTLMAAVAARRTQAGWEVIDALNDAGVGARQEDVAARLGVSQQAISQRLRTALWAEELAARPLAARLLVEASGTAGGVASGSVSGSTGGTASGAARETASGSTGGTTSGAAIGSPSGVARSDAPGAGERVWA